MNQESEAAFLERRAPSQSGGSSDAGDTRPTIPLSLIRAASEESAIPQTPESQRLAGLSEHEHEQESLISPAVEQDALQSLGVAAHAIPQSSLPSLAEVEQDFEAEAALLREAHLSLTQAASSSAPAPAPAAAGAEEAPTRADGDANDAATDGQQDPMQSVKDLKRGIARMEGMLRI